MRILAINVEIGFGHPNYLDYIIQTLKQTRSGIEVDCWDVVNQEKGLAKLFWQVSKKIYVIGAKGGVITDLYNKIRQRATIPNLPICTIPEQDYDRILVSHPLLARYLQNVWYIHGEIAAPQECRMCNVDKVIVPIEETKDKFVEFGVKPDNILVTGLLIDEDLVNCAEENYQKRISRIKSDKALTIGFFISGAYPEPHIKKIITAISSISKENHRAIVFIGTEIKKTREFIKRLNKIQAQTKSSILFVQGKDRRDYVKRINRLIPLLDCFIAASHEHTNWALGLGLPMFVLFPMIGSYAIENFKFAYEQGVAYPLQSIADAQNLDKIILQLRDSGELIRMGQRGVGKFSIDGAKRTAMEIIKN